METEAEKFANEYFEQISKRPDLDIHNDTQWPQETDILLDKMKFTEEFRLRFWLEFARRFNREEEKEGKHYHKGQHYWRIAWMLLNVHCFDWALTYFRLARKEDEIRNKKEFTAAEGVLSLFEPLYRHHKKRKSLGFFNYMTTQEVRAFADSFARHHNNSVAGAYTLIQTSTEYKFIKKPTLRKIFSERYEENRELYFSSQSSPKSFYGSLFLTGSALEGMLDDLFSRNSQKLWSDYKRHFLKTGDFPSEKMLGFKINLVRRLAVNNNYPLPKDVILWMVMISEYRNLIHPNEEYSYKIYRPGRYVCTVLFSSLATIAHYWWSKNQLKP